MSCMICSRLVKDMNGDFVVCFVVILIDGILVVLLDVLLLFYSRDLFSENRKKGYSFT